MFPEENRVLNSLIGEGLADPAEVAATVRLVMRVTLVVPTATDPTQADARLAPVVIERDGVSAMVAFTSGPAAAKVGDRAPFAVTMTGEQAARGLGSGIGLVVDTGSAAMVIPPADIARILAEIDAR